MRRKPVNIKEMKNHSGGPCKSCLVSFKSRRIIYFTSGWCKFPNVLDKTGCKRISYLYEPPKIANSNDNRLMTRRPFRNERRNECLQTVIFMKLPTHLCNSNQVKLIKWCHHDIFWRYIKQSFAERNGVSPRRPSNVSFCYWIRERI